MQTTALITEEAKQVRAFINKHIMHKLLYTLSACMHIAVPCIALLPNVYNHT